MSIAEHLCESGEDAFRDVEAQVVAELCERERTVLALGAAPSCENRTAKRLADCRAVVWLKASAATIESRMAATRRPWGGVLT